MTAPVSIRVRWRKLGGHVHADIWSSEFGPETTHGKNGTLVFRLTEWPAFRAAVEERGDASVLGDTVVEFIDETPEAES